MADLETVLQVQATRTPAEVAWAKRIERDSLYDFADVLGPWFTRGNLPFTAEFFEEAGRDLQAASDRTKGLFARPRPPAVDPRVHPCVSVPASFSYPSGHSTREMVRALLLQEIFPERREELLAWAHRAAWSRIIGGVHFPTDDVGGRLLAEAFVAELLKNPAARAALGRARAEAEPFLAAAAAAHPAVLKPAA
jgi:acid phosphatase (class A)